VSDVTGHCPNCGEPVTLVPISTLVSGALQACPCDAEPEPIGPEDVGFEHRPSRFSEQVQRSDVKLAAAHDESPLPERTEYSARYTGELNVNLTSNR
jgi:hypothetical protein